MATATESHEAKGLLGDCTLVLDCFDGKSEETTATGTELLAQLPETPKSCPDADFPRRLWFRALNGDALYAQLKTLLQRPEELTAEAVRQSIETIDASVSWEAGSLVIETPNYFTFCRDSVGRCGLLLGRQDNGTVHFSSLPPLLDSTTPGSARNELSPQEVDPLRDGTTVWEEVECDGVYQIRKGVDLTSTLTQSSWSSKWYDFSARPHAASTLLSTACASTDQDQDCGVEEGVGCGRLEGFESALQAATDRQLRTWRSSDGCVGVLFSGGIDSTLVASYLATSSLLHHGGDQQVSSRKPSIELYTVLFNGVDSPDYVTALLSYVSLCRTHPNVQFVLLLNEVAEPARLEALPKVKHAVAPQATLMDVTIGSALYFAVKAEGRVVDTMQVALQLLDMDREASEPSELLSNGPPSKETLLPTETLQTQLLQKFGVIDNLIERTGDRLGDERRVQGGPSETTPEAREAQKCSICSRYQMKPLCSNQACAFCCKRLAKASLVKACIAGEGHEGKEDSAAPRPAAPRPAAPRLECSVHKLRKSDEEKPSTRSPIETGLRQRLRFRWETLRESLPLRRETPEISSRFLFCGNGADELFGGYSRYRTKERGLDMTRPATEKSETSETSVSETPETPVAPNLQRWQDEMRIDLSRLWKRNLGRDDRACLMANVNARILHPFLCAAQDPKCSIVGLVNSAPLSFLRHGLPQAPQQFLGEAAAVFAHRLPDSKVVLRHIALNRGLLLPAFFRKRAIQFGSASAKATEDKSVPRRGIKGTQIFA